MSQLKKINLCVTLYKAFIKLCNLHLKIYNNLFKTQWNVVSEGTDFSDYFIRMFLLINQKNK